MVTKVKCAYPPCSTMFLPPDVKGHAQRQVYCGDKHRMAMFYRRKKLEAVDAERDNLLNFIAEIAGGLPLSATSILHVIRSRVEERKGQLSDEE